VANKTINKWLLRISLILLAACATAAQSVAQGVPQDVRGSGPPIVTITQVTELAGAGQKRSFQVQWTTQKPPLTTILKYDLSLGVKFAGGVTQNASQKLGAAATSATFSFPGVPANARALEFGAVVNTTFTTPESSSVTTTREFDLNTDAVQGGVGSGSPLPPDRPVVQIAGAKEIDFNTFEIRWNVQAAPGISIERFGASALVTYQNKAVRPGGEPQLITRQTPVSIATGSQRQTRVVVNNAPPRGNTFAARIKATLDTAFNRSVERTIKSNKEGRF
jgi:hypothetical protein